MQERSIAPPKRVSSSFSTKKHPKKLAVPDATDTIKDNEQVLGRELKLVETCRVEVCKICGCKDCDVEPVYFDLPCDHPWVLAPPMTELLRGSRILPNVGLTKEQIRQVEKREGCGCWR